MSEDKELQAKIAALSGRINQHKESVKYPHNGPNASPTNSDYYAHGRGSSSWAYKRGTPYGVPRGRGGRGRGRGGVAPHRNRTLVMNPPNGSAATGSTSSSPEVQSAGQESTKWVSKVDRHMQLINTSVFDHVSQQRTQAMAETAVQKKQHRDQVEKARLQAHFNNSYPSLHTNYTAPDGPPITTRQHEISIQGITFRVLDGGSKLVRIADDTSLGLSTPKQAQVGGVKFFRSKTGNLYRAGLVKATKQQSITKSAELCPNFSSTGQCSKGPACRFTHDAGKVAVCKDFLAKGSCPIGDACDLSHEPNAHRVPACLHFLRGNCTNDHCRYAHVRVNPSAPVCRDFAKIGYCEKGITCAERHVHECPDYANKGLCRNKKCRLPHVDRAGQLRKVSTEQPTTVDMDDSPDLSTDEGEYDSEDFDSEDAQEFFSNTYTGDVSLQRDYIKL